ncbi:methyltransferase domain-containing protein [Desulfuromonas sp. CSMB_57]|jgi:SAM-dependent methyltransferase|uniref:class I SAM-dependent methyltransferase n=1 Tax=Desulfuromonas sp. CSMB_57 TaxID=2807629 RepID=UPI001CD2A180|nr:methyltransferase domain-containing protein [Desulfuromonas sp. CSMB_57]
MKEWLLDLLICPACLPAEHSLRARVDDRQRDDILEGRLTCSACGAHYPICSGIAFLEPHRSGPRPESKYETASVLSSYLWSHYGDLLPDPEASDAYRAWAELLRDSCGTGLDLGSAVGRMSFEMSRFCERVVGIDNSVAFIRTARELLQTGRKTFDLRLEGLLTEPVTVILPETWSREGVEFIVGDALALPFRGAGFASLASLNLIDKVPLPLQHLREMNRVARAEGAQLLLSDPFSWSTDAASEADWLGGKPAAPYAGRGLDNVCELLAGRDQHLQPAWRIAGQGHVWWKIRTHSNHFELIRSCYVKAGR